MRCVFQAWLTPKEMSSLRTLYVTTKHAIGCVRVWHGRLWIMDGAHCFNTLKWPCGRVSIRERNRASFARVRQWRNAISFGMSHIVFIKQRFIARKSSCCDALRCKLRFSIRWRRLPECWIREERRGNTVRRETPRIADVVSGRMNDSSRLISRWTSGAHDRFTLPECSDSPPQPRLIEVRDLDAGARVHHAHRWLARGQ